MTQQSFSSIRMLMDVREQLRTSIQHLRITVPGVQLDLHPLKERAHTVSLGILEGILVSSLYPNMARVRGCVNHTILHLMFLCMSRQFASGKQNKIMVCEISKLNRESYMITAAITDAAWRRCPLACQLLVSHTLSDRCFGGVFPANTHVAPVSSQRCYRRCLPKMHCRRHNLHRFAQRLAYLMFAGADVDVEIQGARSVLTIDGERWLACMMETDTAVKIKVLLALAWHDQP